MGVDEYVGSLEIGKIADLVIWDRAFFGVKPDVVIKGGFIACSVMGDSNASIPTSGPLIYRNMFGSFGKAAASISALFVAKDTETEQINTDKQMLKVKNTRNISKKDMKLNDFIGDVSVDPETYEVRVNGDLIESSSIDVLPLARNYFLF
jgi:urease subunit alpha